MIGAATVDAINPCDCTVLVLLLGTILVSSKGRRSRVLGTGFAFKTTCFISYFLMGLGLFTVIRVAGIVVSLLLLPCTSGPYVVIIGMLSNTSTRWQAVGYLLLYNLIFILPFVLITLGVGLGFTTTARVEALRREKLEKMHFITGLMMLALGLIMLGMVLLGFI